MNIHQILAVCVTVFLALPIVVVSIRKRSLPESISELSYSITDGLFTTWIALISMVVLYLMLVKCSTEMEPLALLTATGLFVVAASPYYKQEAGRVHYIGGWTAAICSMLFVAFSTPYLLAGWVVLVPFLWSKKRIFVAEVICGLILLISLMV